MFDNQKGYFSAAHNNQRDWLLLDNSEIEATPTELYEQLKQLPFKNVEPYQIDDGMPQKVWINKYGRRSKEIIQDWDERIQEVILGNFSLDTKRTFTISEFERTMELARKGVIVTSGRHLQHGGLGQDSRPIELQTNCATSIFSFMNFLLLMFGCFRKGTKIKMADGSYKNIEEVNVGDLVVSWNENNKEFINKTVVATHVNPPKPMVKVHLQNGETVICTFDHKFILEDGTECMAKDLKGKKIKMMGE